MNGPSRNVLPAFVAVDRADRLRERDRVAVERLRGRRERLRARDPEVRRVHREHGMRAEQLVERDAQIGRADRGRLVHVHRVARLGHRGAAASRECGGDAEHQGSGCRDRERDERCAAHEPSSSVRVRSVFATGAGSVRSVRGCGVAESSRGALPAGARGRRRGRPTPDATARRMGHVPVRGRQGFPLKKTARGGSRLGLT